MNPKVSLVVTCYNHEKYVEACLRSIFAQTYQNIELLVYNDGSTDQSGQVISSVLTESPFAETHYFSDKNQGLAFIKNKALQQITGEFLLFVDSDNFLDADYVEKLLSALTESEKDIAYCQLWDFTNEKKMLREDLDYSLEKELEGNMIDSCSLVRVASIKNSKFDEHMNNKALEDYDFWLSLILENQAKPVYVETTKLNYRVLEGSMSSRGDWKNYYDSYLHILNKYASKETEAVTQALKNNILLWVENYQNLNLQKEEQEKTYQKALADKDQHIQDREAFITQALHDKDVYIAEKEAEIEILRNSKAYRLGNKILHPFRK